MLTSYRASGSDNALTIPSIGGSRGIEVSDEFRLMKWHFLARAQSSEGGAKNPRAIMITSAKNGEGKSYVAHHLAANFALDPHVELTLIDADTDNPALGSSSWMVGSTGGSGLLDYLESNEVSESQILRTTGLPNVKVILSGNSRQHAPELFGNVRFERLIGALTSHANAFVIIDGGAVLSNGGAAVLARRAGQIGYVVAANVTSRSDINAGLAALDRIAGPIDENSLGLIFN